MKYRRGPTRFTLVELLVVIAILSILAGLLMPMMKKAMDSARKLSCMNNLKQFSLVFDGYVGDWRGYLPTDSWPKVTFSYTGLGEERWIKGIYFCSSYAYDMSWTWNISYTPAYSIRGTYGYNYVYLYQPRTPPPPYVGRISRIKNPSGFCVLMDSKWYSIDSCNSAVYYGTNPPYDKTYPSNIHSNGSNVLFVDGSVRWFLREQLIGNTARDAYWNGGM